MASFQPDTVTWQGIEASTSKSIRAMDIITLQKGYLVGGPGPLFKKADSGLDESFQDVDVTGADIGNNSFYDIEVRADDNIWLVGSEGIILNYDGSSFTKYRPIEANVGYRAITALDDNNMWVTGANDAESTMIVYWDGSEWYRIPTDSNNLMYDIAISENGKQGWAVGNGGSTIFGFEFD